MSESRGNLVDIKVNGFIKRVVYVVHKDTESGLNKDSDAYVDKLFDMPWLSNNDDEYLIVVKEKPKKLKSRKKRYGVNQDVI